MHFERSSRWEPFGLRIVLNRSFSLWSHNNPLTSGIGINITSIPLVSDEHTDSNTVSSVSADKLYEWNIDGLSEQEIINRLSHMSIYIYIYICILDFW